MFSAVLLDFRALGHEKVVFFNYCLVLWVAKEPPEFPRGALGVPLAPLGSFLGCSLGALGASWVVLGMLLNLLGYSLCALGASWVALGPLGEPKCKPRGSITSEI